MKKIIIREEKGNRVLKNEKQRGAYLGFYPTLLREVIALSIYFSVYEFGMRYLAPDGDPFARCLFCWRHFWCLFLAFSYPIDYIKTVIQSQQIQNMKYKSAINCAIKKYQQEGLKTFFRGLGVTTMRSFPVNGAGFFAFEGMIRRTGKKSWIGQNF